MVKADSDKYKNMLKEVRKLCEKLNDIIDDDIVIRIPVSYTHLDVYKRQLWNI